MYWEKFRGEIQLQVLNAQTVRRKGHRLEENVTMSSLGERVRDKKQR
jgi:hypothetical protein